MGKHRKPSRWARRSAVPAPATDNDTGWTDVGWTLADWPKEGDFGIFNEATGEIEPYYSIVPDLDDPARGWITPPKTMTFTIKNPDPAVIALFYGEALGTSTPIYDALLAEQEDRDWASVSHRTEMSDDDIEALAAFKRRLSRSTGIPYVEGCGCSALGPCYDHR